MMVQGILEKLGLFGLISYGTNLSNPRCSILMVKIASLYQRYGMGLVVYFSKHASARWLMRRLTQLVVIFEPVVWKHASC